MPKRSRGFIALNIIRGFSVIALSLGIVASITHLVKSFIQSKYFLFDVLNNLTLALLCAFLLISETPLLSTYYKRRWPLFGPDSSLVSIGIAEVLVGFQLLGMVNDQAHEGGKESFVTISFDKILITAGALNCITGVVTFISNYIFCNSQTHITARHIRTVSKETREPRTPLARVAVESGPTVPQRTFSKASRVAPPNGEMSRRSSATSSKGAFPYVTSSTENRGSWVEGSEAAFSSSQYGDVRPAPAPTGYGVESPYAPSETGESSYSSKPSPSQYRVKGNPYARIEE